MDSKARVGIEALLGGAVYVISALWVNGEPSVCKTVSSGFDSHQRLLWSAPKGRHRGGNFPSAHFGGEFRGPLLEGQSDSRRRNLS